MSVFLLETTCICKGGKRRFISLASLFCLVFEMLSTKVALDNVTRLQRERVHGLPHVQGHSAGHTQ